VDSLNDDYEDGYAHDFATNTSVSLEEASRAVPVSNDGSPGVVLNGEALNFSLPIINVSGRTFYPLRELLDAIGAEVGWDNETKTASGAINSLRVEFIINSEEYYATAKKNRWNRGSSRLYRNPAPIYLLGSLARH
jgi:hypothetical protein